MKKFLVAIRNLLPTADDATLLLGLAMAGTGIAFQYTWPLALMVIGGILFSLALFAKIKGNG